MQDSATLLVNALGQLDPGIVRQAFHELATEPGPLTRQRFQRKVNLDRRLRDHRRGA